MHQNKFLAEHRLTLILQNSKIMDVTITGMTIYHDKITHG